MDTIIINTRSWHYRYASWVYHRISRIGGLNLCRSLAYFPPRSLCGYFWWVVWALLAPVWGAALGIFFLIPCAALVVIALILAVPLGIAWGVKKSRPDVVELVKAYVAAKHRKMCPFVEYRKAEDEDLS